MVLLPGHPRVHQRHGINGQMNRVCFNDMKPVNPWLKICGNNNGATRTISRLFQDVGSLRRKSRRGCGAPIKLRQRTGSLPGEMRAWLGF